MLAACFESATSTASRFEISKLLITIPPRFGKSNEVSVFWPVWMWASSPERRLLYASYAESLPVRDAVKSRRLIQSGWYGRCR